MQILIVSPISNLKFDRQEDFQIGIFKIVNSEPVRERLNSDIQFVLQVGTKTMDVLNDAPFFYYEGESSNLFPEVQLANDAQILTTTNRQFASIINGLWFNKDNCAFTYKCYLQNLQTNNVIIDTRNHFSSNSIGKYSPQITFTIDEFWDGYMKYYNLKHHDFNTDINQQMLSNLDIRDNSGNANPRNSIPYNASRIGRALRFLEIARSNSDLIIKITYYIALLECLFTSSTTNPISKKLARRVAAFLNTNRKTFEQNADFFRTVYDSVRNEFIHGNAFKTSPDSHFTISEKLDEFVRQIFNGVMTNPAVFLLPEIEENIPTFETHFDELALKAEKGIK